MTVSEVLDLAGFFLREPSVTNREPDDPELLALVGGIVSEIGEEYFPLAGCDTFGSGGEIPLSQFSAPPLRVLWVHDRFGRAVAFRLEHDRLRTACDGFVRVRFHIAPAQPVSEAETVSLAPFVSARAVALGVAADYSLFHNLYEQAAAFDRKYRETLSALSPRRAGRIPGGDLR